MAREVTIEDVLIEEYQRTQPARDALDELRVCAATVQALPKSREQALAFTKLQEAIMWLAVVAKGDERV